MQEKEDDRKSGVTAQGKDHAPLMPGPPGYLQDCHQLQEDFHKETQEQSNKIKVRFHCGNFREVEVSRKSRSKCCQELKSLYPRSGWEGKVDGAFTLHLFLVLSAIG